MKNIKYILLGLILASFADNVAYAEDSALPKLELPSDDSSFNEEKSPEELLEVPGVNSASEDKSKKQAPSLPATPAVGEKKEILDKAIKEVFEEPKKEVKKIEEKVKKDEEELPDLTDNVVVTATGSAAKPKTPELPSEVPEVDEAEEPLFTDVAPKDENKIEKPVTAVVPQEEGNKNDDILASPVDEIVSPVAEPVVNTETKKDTEPKAAVKAEEKPNVAPEKFKQEGDKPKPKPKKKKSLPKKTPKSLREDYLEQKFDPNSVPSSGLNYVSPPSSVGFPPNTKPIQDMKMPENTLPGKTPDSLKQGSIEGNDLDAIQEFPSKKKVLEVDGGINIDKGNFVDPFGSGNSGGTPIDALAETPVVKGDKVSGTPVVDFSDTADQEDPALKGKASKPENFYMAESGLEMEVKDAPENSLDSMKNAYEALQVGQYESSIRYYNEALQQNPNNKKALFGIATAYHMSKDYEKARESYLKIMKLDPNYWPAVNNYIILVTEENPEKSIERLEELYAKNPTFAAIPAQLGSLYFSKGNLQKSIEYYVNAVKLEPENVEYRYNLAVILENAAKYQDAATIYKSLLDDAAAGVKLPENPISIKDRYDVLISKK